MVSITRYSNCFANRLYLCLLMCPSPAMSEVLLINCFQLTKYNGLIKCRVSNCITEHFSSFPELETSCLVMLVCVKHSSFHWGQLIKKI